jgi:hypothetical protein
MLEETKFVLEVQESWLMPIRQALGKLPFDDVHKIISGIDMQLQPQIQAKYGNKESK